MQSEVHILLEKLEEWYPNTMVLTAMNEFDRAKLAGKVELIQEIRALIEKKDNDNQL